MSSVGAVPAGIRHRAPPSTAGRRRRPAYPADEASRAGQKTRVYWVYWGVCFATVITWLFAMVAASDDAWIQFEGYPLLELGRDCEFSEPFCKYYKAGTTFQLLATILITTTLAVIAVAAFKPAPTTGKLGMATGVMLLIFSSLQLVAFFIMAASAEQLNRDNDNFFQIKAGPTIGVGVMAWLFGLAGGSAVLLLRPLATLGQDGPLTRCTYDTHRATAATVGRPASLAPTSSGVMI